MTNYSKNNFYTAPAGDGAFIVKNSWEVPGEIMVTSTFLTMIEFYLL